MPKYAQEILALIWEYHRHMTAEQIYMEMKRRGSRVSQATVYNNLHTLTAEGKIVRISSPGQPDRYDNTSRHDHLVCDLCGALSDLDLSDLTQAIEEQMGQGILSYDLRVHYLCPACRRARGASGGTPQ